MMKEYLAFVEKISDDMYSFQFSQNPDIVWGMDWNVCPSAIVPGIKADQNCISSCYIVKTKNVLNTAGENSCFSMQDCIDGIIPLVYSNLEFDTLEIDGKPFICRFGEKIEDIKERLDKYSLDIVDHKVFTSKKDEIIDDLLDDLDDFNENN